MDCYAFILDQLHADNCRRLTKYQPTSAATFEVWLAVVARRLCMDHYRQKYGRGLPDQSPEERQHRRLLADLICDAVVEEVPSPSIDAATALARQDVSAALATVLEALEPRDRLLLRYRFDDELSAREIAGLMSFPTAFHVYRRLNALLAWFRTSLKQRGFDAGDL